MEYRKLKIGDVALLGLLISIIIAAVIVAIKSGYIIGGILFVLVACCGSGTFIFFWYVSMIKTYPKVKSR